MNCNRNVLLVVTGSLCTMSAPAFADFAGQPILGPITAGTSVTGTTLGAPDNNDGWDSGTHILDIWNGGDRVYQLNWFGGDINLTLTSLGGSDNDLFLYSPGDYDTASHESFRGSLDTIQVLGASAGIYYIVVDSTEFSEGSYQLDVAAVPAPGVAGMLGLAALCGRGRRRNA